MSEWTSGIGLRLNPVMGYGTSQLTPHELKRDLRSIGSFWNLKKTLGHCLPWIGSPEKYGMRKKNQKVHFGHSHGAKLDLDASTVDLHQSRFGMVRCDDPV